MPSTTIKLSEKTKSRLDKVKIHPRETYEDVIIRLLDAKNSSSYNSESVTMTPREAIQRREKRA